MDWQRNRRNSPPHFVDPCNDDCLESGFKQWQPGFASGVERSRVQSKKVWQEQHDMHPGGAQLSDVVMLGLVQEMEEAKKKDSMFVLGLVTSCDAFDANETYLITSVSPISVLKIPELDAMQLLVPFRNE